ncbi:MAG TPA: ABC transporter ATP-binding protein [Gemmatimonadaceae bacterium]|nr:ABC transporter ATP-binding protein [Gemmatimonadaceae bacterium]
MIAFADVRARYPRQQHLALGGVSLDAERGSVTAVVGPNGSGKSTLIRALIGRVPLAAGTISIDGADTRTWSREAIARRVAVVTQREETTFPMTVREYVALGRLPHRGTWGRDTMQDRAAVDAAIARTGMHALADRSVHQLSGGEWQRVRFARALAQGGDALVADEPTTFLDIAHEMAVFELMRSVAADGHAVLMVSHQLNLVARFADRLVLLHDGRVAAAGTVNDVMRPEILEQVYEWPVLVTRDAAIGALTLVPLRKPSTSSRS